MFTEIPEIESVSLALLRATSGVAIPEGKLESIYILNDIDSSLSFLRKIETVLIAILKLKKILAKANYDIVVTLNLEPNVSMLLVKKLWIRKQKVITTEHTNLKAYFKSFSVAKFLFRKIAASLYALSNLSVGCSQEVTQSLREVYSVSPVKSDTVYNSIREDFLLAGEAKFNSKSYICASGRLDPQKGFAELISSLEGYLKETGKDLIIIGEGEDRGRLEELIKELNLQDQVKLLGFIENPANIIVNAWVYVSASFLEGMPLNIIEAMSLGVPVISTDCLSGPREIIAQQAPYDQNQDFLSVNAAGILIPVPDTSNQFKNQLIKALEVLENECNWKRISLASIKRSDFFTSNNIKRKWLEVLTRSVNHGI